MGGSVAAPPDERSATDSVSASRTITIDVLPLFAWPSGAGVAEGIMFHAAMTDPGITSLFGELDTFTFGWH